MIQLKTIVAIRTGYPFRTRLEPDSGGNTLVLQMKDIGPQGTADVAGAVRISLKAPESHRLAPGDLVIKSRGNTHCNVIGRVPDDPLIAAVPLFVLRPDPRAITPEFLRWLLNHPKTQAQLGAAAVGTYIPTITKPALEALELPVPPLRTQELIVRVAELAEREQTLLELIATRRKDATDRLLMRLSRSPENRRE
jgi:restriction endonuclease S subunit